MRTKSEKLNLSGLDYEILNDESKRMLIGGRKQMQEEEEAIDGGTLDEIVVTPELNDRI